MNGAKMHAINTEAWQNIWKAQMAMIGNNVEMIKTPATETGVKTTGGQMQMAAHGATSLVFLAADIGSNMNQDGMIALGRWMETNLLYAKTELQA